MNLHLWNEKRQRGRWDREASVCRVLLQNDFISIFIWGKIAFVFRFGNIFSILLFCRPKYGPSVHNNNNLIRAFHDSRWEHWKNNYLLFHNTIFYGIWYPLVLVTWYFIIFFVPKPKQHERKEKKNPNRNQFTSFN